MPYSVRWNNHQNYILSAFEELLNHEDLVDVTLACSETRVRAHKVVLSACSPYFQKIFSEYPCPHPIIFLKDFTAWELQAIIDFMYKGEISIIEERLQRLIKAAESLQVRGLANQQDDKESTSIRNQTPTPTPSPPPPPPPPNDYVKRYSPNGGRFPTPGVTVRTPSAEEARFSPLPHEPPAKLQHMSRLPYPPDAFAPRHECQSPLPRRKQARPRRRSGEITAAQDLTKPPPPLLLLPPPPLPLQQHPPPSTSSASSSPIDNNDTPLPENLSMKKDNRERMCDDEPKMAVTPGPPISPDLDYGLLPKKEFRTSPPVCLPPTLSARQEIDSHSPLHFPPMPSVSALTMTPPHSKFFGLDSPLGLFTPGLDCRSPLFDMTDPRTTPDPQMFVKKKMGRPKGQHSAPRGGPPRSWTNAELTEALQQVWNKRMTTSQASRVFGIPYNSLLMYVRGKYGKSLKLEQLRNNCIGGINPANDILGLGGGAAGNHNNNNNNNNNSSNHNNNTASSERDSDLQSNTRPSSREDEMQPQPPPPSVFNPFAHNFYPDFATGFPIPVSMIHLLPQSENSREQQFGPPLLPEDDCNTGRSVLGGGVGGVGSGASSKRVKKEFDDIEQDMLRPPPPTLSADDRQDLVHQNGQD